MRFHVGYAVTQYAVTVHSRVGFFFEWYVHGGQLHTREYLPFDKKPEYWPRHTNVLSNRSRFAYCTGNVRLNFLFLWSSFA